MTRAGIMRKVRFMLAALFIGTTLSGCATNSVGRVFGAVLETTAHAVADIVVETTENVAVAGAEMLVSGAVACIDNDKPVLSGALPNPVLNQQYTGTIHVGIRNEPYDDNYAYKFEVYGDFPAGMRSESDGRQLILSGAPTSPGIYNFQIRVTVEDGVYGANDTDGLCFTVDDEGFQWTIQQSEYAQFAS